jgi:hypothetical protein
LQRLITSGDVGRIGEHGENEHQILSTHNPEVVGSNPAPATKNMQVIGLSDGLFLCWYYVGTALVLQATTVVL